MPFRGHKSIQKPDGSAHDSWFSYTCGHCGKGVSGAVVAHLEKIRWLLCTSCNNGSVRTHQEEVFPSAPFGPQIEGLPQEVESIYKEARRSMGVQAFTGVELLCRTILMHVAVDKADAKEKENFTHYIDCIEKAGYITPAMKPWVTLIRQHGGAAAHTLKAPDRSRAESTVLFTAELLRIVYEMEHMAKQYAPESDSTGKGAAT